MRIHTYLYFYVLLCGEFERLAIALDSLTLTLLQTDNKSFFFLIIIQEGTCFLRGEELFANQFQLDTLERKFAKDKHNAVTLIIQLCSKRY